MVLYMLAAMLLSLGSMAYTKHQNDYKAFPQLTAQYAVGALTSGNPETDNRRLLLEAVNQSGGDHLLALRFDGIQGFAVYYTEKSCFPLKLKEGRLFSEEDFKQGKDVALVSESVRKECQFMDGRAYWDYGGSLFQVIGVYDDVDLYGDKSPDCFLNLCAKQLDPSIFDSFIYDAGHRTMEDLGAVKAFVEEKSQLNYFQYAQVGSQAAEEFRTSATSFAPMFMMLVLTALLVVLNSVSAVQNWLLARRGEIAVRKLVGAANASIYLWIGKGLSVLMLLSFAMGAILSRLALAAGLALPTQESVRLMFGVRMQWGSLLYGFFAMVLLCGGTAAVTVWRFQKTEIARALTWT